MALIPPDVRATRDFRIIKGLDNILRTDHAVDTSVSTAERGQWLVLNGSNALVNTSTETLASPAQNVVCCWTKYVKDDPSAGQSDAVATGNITSVSGSYMAETKFFESTGTFTPGFLLVVQADTTTAAKGVLNAVDGASATAKQIAGSVGRVVKLENGVLTYRTNGAA